MKDEITLNGIILFAAPQGEYDKRLVILTKERGKVTAFARGARRANNQLISKSQLFVMGSFTLIPGRNAYSLVNADVTDYFRDLTNDMEKYCYGSYFCEVMNYLTREGEGAADYLNLLYVSLNALRKNKMSPKLIRLVYEVKLLDIFGSGIQSYYCPVCGNDKLAHTFSIKTGGVVCEGCADRVEDKVAIDKDIIYILQYINGATLGKLYSFTIPEDTFTKLNKLTQEFFNTYVGKHFNSADIIQAMT